ncbi:hypothetical protein J3R30DRAFT_641182 [Lentinula aciculospora]|uniref:Fungal-type protein kinase domain-containing protein n=1 Tax=Lentinula aciculospora TaxID=153920 RepID=A0A9W9A5N1_9AGAR|nr:hypothetical protein J3R30DRAFT_641182 [Lentinula aciculospora]
MADNSHGPANRPHMTANPASSPVLPIAKETPYKSRTTDLSKYREGVLDGRRDAVIEDLGNMVPEVDLHWFFENLLPPLPNGLNIQAVVNQLQECGTITEAGWAGFSMDPKVERRHEHIVFARLAPIFQAIIDTVIKLHPSLQQTFTLLLQPKRLPVSERGRSSKPDNCWVSMEDAENIKKDPSRFYTWYSIASPAEDKRLAESSREERNKNVAQIIYNLQQIMSLDPCRRFTFGKTMQNRHMRVWFACRGYVLTTKPCDFLKDYNRLVHLFIAFAFSSRQGLGWDPTMTCINPQFSPSEPRKRRVYGIEVRNDKGEVKTFKTVRILADYAADSTVSRATRVWLVEDDEGVEHVLKDVWLDTDRHPEHEIRAQMLADVLKECGPEDYATLQKHLLTPYIGGRVYVEGVVDTTDGIMRNGEMPQLSPGSIFILKLEKTLNPLSQSRDPASAGTYTRSLTGTGKGLSKSRKSRMKSQATTTLQSLPVLRHKYHYRIVFIEHGQTLFEEKSLLNVYITLTSILTALYIIHRSGWVHRDISCGNVYFYDKDDPRGILGDLEYARRCESTEAHQLRTGTLDFMASEVILQRWDHLPLPPEDDGGDFPQPSAFAYNPLHDLESCWWLLVYILLHNDDTANVQADPDALILRHNVTMKLFTRRPDTSWRGNFMRNPGIINVQTIGLSSSLAPAVRTVSRMAGRLVRAFTMAEQPYTSVTVGNTILKEMVYDMILPLINEDSPTRAEIRNIHLQTIPRVVVTGEKRKAEEEDAGVGEGLEDEQGPKFKKSRTQTSSITDPFSA